MTRTATMRFHVKHAPAFQAQFEGRFEIDTRPYRDPKLITYWMDYEADMEEFLDWADDRNANFSVMIMRHGIKGNAPTDPQE